MADYPADELKAIYELGKLYFEMGYFVPAERIFQGLLASDAEEITPARLGVGLVKLETGLFQESTSFFRTTIEKATFGLEGQLALAMASLGLGDTTRVRALLRQMEIEVKGVTFTRPDLFHLWESLMIRCEN